ncbi:hypothetical protein [Mucilaginibacter phyllosphaerae]|uniref:DUF4595 domain-containing protein n=1 Tax=Mucilaginibacter phyllosphaerae TaxID=1812349 RepID=A0A4Y8AEG6_9SPHI|nr:hypothetical protein [Mucilaginibacter phyllosphaerae]MBB3970150.1 hypothetical protein [Mucilaginibacter phyllosphaerae]TEW66535.1 hypothetical protein E2R65_08915 [Mucilaginibacter phyllosphaerae]GGH10119.1 hypothetical protein GCM10007352_15790 [Mucilaginibacter phyllosphaerae]
MISCTKKQKNDLQEGHVHGNVNEIIVNRYKAETKFGEIVKDKIQLHTVSTFNKAGNTEASDNTWYYGSADSAEVHNNKFSFQYDDKGHNNKIIIVNKPTEYTLKKYNGELLVEVDDFESGKLSSKAKYIYDSGNLLSEINRYDANGKFTGKEKFSYANDLVSQLQVYKANGELNFKYGLTYDDNGNTLTEKQISGEYPFSHTFKYSNIDENGNWLKCISYTNGKPETYTERIIKYR